MLARICLILALIVLIVGCGREVVPPTATSPLIRAQAMPSELDRAAPPVSASSEFFPLGIGNRWRYAGLSVSDQGGTVSRGRWSREFTVGRIVERFGRTYAELDGTVRDEQQEYRTLRWLRQDRYGLYELGVAPPGVPPGTEQQLLAYPLHVGATWMIAQVPPTTATVDRLEMLDTPAGRFPAWRIRIRNGGHLPNEEAYVWYGRAGYLGMKTHLRFERPGSNGNPIVIVEDQSEWLQSIDLAPTEVGGRFEVVGVATVTSGGTLVGPDHRVRPTFGYDLGNAAREKLLFNEVWIDSSSVGSVLVATPRSDPDFPAVVDRLTNGVADYVCVGTCEQISCGATCAEEPRLFGLATPDFKGATIERVSLRIDSLSFRRDDRGGQIVLYQFTIKVYGLRTRHPA